MRLIDADALRDAIDEIPYDSVTWQTVTKDDVIGAIMDAPTVALSDQHITINWTPDLDKLSRDVAFRGLNEFSFMGKSIREWVEIILEQTSRRWVSVEDRLPEKKGDYIAYTKDGIVWPYWFDDIWFDTLGYATDTVTHWMPLPEPPKEVSGDAIT